LTGSRHAAAPRRSELDPLVSAEDLVRGTGEEEERERERVERKSRGEE
jgi:hypothetical protein